MAFKFGHRFAKIILGSAVFGGAAMVLHDSRSRWSAHAATTPAPPLSDPKVPIPLSALPSRASTILRQREEEFDVLVIGGGATGLGIALDAQVRLHAIITSISISTARSVHEPSCV